MTSNGQPNNEKSSLLRGEFEARIILSILGILTHHTSLSPEWILNPPVGITAISLILSFNL
jgi:hypothetical protein